jgi:hypothetical protein
MKLSGEDESQRYWSLGIVPDRLDLRGSDGGSAIRAKHNGRFAL